MAVHRGVQLLARIGFVIAHGQPLLAEQADGMAGGAIVLVVQQAHFPRALFVARGQAGGEAVQRDDHARFNPFNQLAQFIVIGPMKQVQPRFHIRADIAGDQMPVAFRRDHGCIVFRAMEIADQPADAGDMRGDIVAAGQPVGDAFHPDIDCDVFFQKARIDAQLDPFGNMVRCVIDHA